MSSKRTFPFLSTILNSIGTSPLANGLINISVLVFSPDFMLKLLALNSKSPEIDTDKFSKSSYTYNSTLDNFLAASELIKELWGI